MFLFLYLTKKSFFTTVIWFPVFSFIIHVVDIVAQSVLASTLLIARISHKNVLKVVYAIYGSFFFFMVVSIILFLLPITSKVMYKNLFQNNLIILICDLVYLVMVSVFFIISRFKANPFLKASMITLFFAYLYHAVTIFYPPAIRFLIVYNLLIILGYLLIEIFIFYEIIK